MMDSARLQDTIDRGLGTAARAIGVVCNAFRPAGSVDPLASGNRFLQLCAAFNARDPQFRRAGLPADAVWNGVFDAAYLRAGDYLVERVSGRIWFVAALQSLLPATCVLTNHLLTVLRPGAPAAPGANPYGGATEPTTLLSRFPGSLLHGGAGRAGGQIPADTRIGGAVAMLPLLAGLTITRGDLLRDDQGRRYVASDAERNAFGWRVDVQQVVS